MDVGSWVGVSVEEVGVKMGVSFEEVSSGDSSMGRGEEVCAASGSAFAVACLSQGIGVRSAPPRLSSLPRSVSLHSMDAVEVFVPFINGPLDWMPGSRMPPGRGDAIGKGKIEAGLLTETTRSRARR